MLSNCVGGGEVTRRRRRRDHPDENINLHIIKAAAIKAIEIMQIIRKRRCSSNFCRHLKSFRRLLSMNIEQPRTCRSPPPFPIVPSSSPSHLAYHLPHFPLRNDFKHELVHHWRFPREITLSINWREELRAMNKREGGKGREIKIICWKSHYIESVEVQCTRPRFREFQFCI